MENISAEELRKLIFKLKWSGRRVLDLSRKGLSKVPEAVTDLTELEEHNYLKELPTSINKLKNLRWLTLDGLEQVFWVLPHRGPCWTWSAQERGVNGEGSA